MKSKILSRMYLLLALWSIRMRRGKGYAVKFRGADLG